jgi:uncharacterized protein YdaU (DUF1376 family)
MKKTYLQHQSNSFTDIKIIKMRSKLGIESYGIFWALLELLFNEENKLCIDDYSVLAFSLQCDADKLKSVIEDFDLFIIEDGCFYSRRLNNHIEEINNKSNKAKENASKRWNNATAMQPHSDRNASKVNKSKVNKSKSIEERIIDFSKSIQSIEGINDEDKKAFFLYWTEKNKSGSKYRAEMEKTFDISRRLKRWSSNNFNKQKSRFPDYFDSLLMKRMDDSSKKEYEQHLKNLGYVTEYNPNAGQKWIKK